MYWMLHKKHLSVAKVSSVRVLRQTCTRRQPRLDWRERLESSILSRPCGRRSCSSRPLHCSSQPPVRLWLPSCPPCRRQKAISARPTAGFTRRWMGNGRGSSPVTSASSALSATFGMPDDLEAAIESRGLVFTLLSKDGLIWRTPPRAPAAVVEFH